MPDSDDIVVEKGEGLLVHDPNFYCNGIFKGGMNIYIYIYLCVCVCACMHVCTHVCVCVCVCVCDMLSE